MALKEEGFSADWAQLVLYYALLGVLAYPLGAYVARADEGDAGVAEKVVGPLQRLVYRLL